MKYKGYFTATKCEEKALITIYNNNHQIIFETVQDYKNMLGYLYCLEDIGYKNGGWENIKEIY